MISSVSITVNSFTVQLALGLPISCLGFVIESLRVNADVYLLHWTVFFRNYMSIKI